MIRKPFSRAIHVVLFDFDGTLADTAPDLAGAVNAMRKRRGLAALPLAKLRPWASHGARGLIGTAFGVEPNDPSYEPMRVEFLADYEAALCAQTTLFEGMPTVLEQLERHGLRWGIVTNKMARLTAPIVRALHIERRAAVVVSGDTTPYAKPHPAPLLHAAAELGVDPADCVYIGDDERDIVAGRAAGMATIAAAYGYCSEVDPRRWEPDAIIDAPKALLGLIGLPVPA